MDMDMDMDMDMGMDMDMDMDMGMDMGMGMGRSVRARFSLRPAFTLIELIIVIGIIMILVGLIAPALGQAMSQAKLTRDIALVRQQAMLISMYASDFQDTYPYPYDLTGHISRVAGDWVLPMIQSGHVNAIADMDPGTERGLAFSYTISVAMVYDADKMRPGLVPPRDDQQSLPTRTHQVLFPSSKGLTVRMHDGINTGPGGVNGFCCGLSLPHWPAPISFADGSATSGIMTDFLGGLPPYLEYGIGGPVYSTWFGVRGRDR